MWSIVPFARSILITIMIAFITLQSYKVSCQTSAARAPADAVAPQELVKEVEVMFRRRSSFRPLKPKPPPLRFFKRPPFLRLSWPPPVTARSQPSPRRAPPPRPPPPPPLFEDIPELIVVCPETLDYGGYPQAIKNCSAPIGRVEDGDKLVEQHKIKTGDKAIILLQVNPGSGRRAALGEGGALTFTAALGAFRSDASNYRVQISKFTRQGRQKEIYSGTPIRLRTVVFVLNFANCTNAPGWTNLDVKSVAKYLFMDTSPVPNSLENYYSTCTYNKTLFRKEDTTVVPVPINVTCAGSTLNETQVVEWNSAQACDVAEQFAWEEQAEDQAQLIAATNPQLARILNCTERRRNIYILPPRVPCNWAGYGDVTCTGFTCKAFVRATNLTTLTYMDMHVMMHEAMHNYGLDHAGTPVDSLGDPSDVMGNFGLRQGLLCPSAPHLYRIGVATPINEVRGVGKGWYGNLTAANFTGSKPLRLTLPCAAWADDHMISIDLGMDRRNPGISQIMPVFYLSYRVRSPKATGYDSALDPAISSTVLVHSYSGKQDENTLARPNFVASIPANRNWSSATSYYVPYIPPTKLGGFITVSVVSATASEAIVSLCRGTARAEAGDLCFDGVDNDCDGLSDGYDSGCRLGG